MVSSEPASCRVFGVVGVQELGDAIAGPRVRARLLTYHGQSDASRAGRVNSSKTLNCSDGR